FVVLTIASTGIDACSATSSAPLGQVVANPTSLTFTCLAGTISFSVTQANYSGMFSAVSANTSLVTVAPASSSGAFTATEQAATGVMTSITVTGGGNMSVTIPVQLPSCVCHRHHDMWATAFPTR
ncbi:MAG TPA: hypothetical protein VK216_01250, partial [Magnetospirillaceae bacterium]|nr:hypothetical protein [Magnetospirillaceae bacterium]